MATPPDVEAALRLATTEPLQPDLVVIDNNSADAAYGRKLAAQLQAGLAQPTSILILTQETSAQAGDEIAGADFTLLAKPFQLDDLALVIQRLLQQVSVRPPTALPCVKPAQALHEGAVVFIVDDDADIRRSLRGLIENGGGVVEDFADCDAFSCGLTSRAAKPASW